MYYNWISSLNKDYVKFFSQSIQSYSREKLTYFTPNLINHSDSKQDAYHVFKVNYETFKKPASNSRITCVAKMST